MAEMPEPMHSTASKIYAAYESGGGSHMADFRKKSGVPEPDNGLRAHLGASVIGRPCERELWLKFRWAEKASFQGRMLRLFETGHLEEPRLIANLRDIGIDVHDKDPAGNQWRLEALGGHFGGSMDAAAVGVPEAPKTWHVCEFKTSNEKSFNKMVKEGVKKAKPEHFAQMQVYMGLTGMTRALYIMKNKNDEQLHIERVEFNEQEFDRLMERARRIITAQEPPPRISSDATYFECKYCDFYQHCHGEQVPIPTCRSCAHATPELNGRQRWSCAKWSTDVPKDAQEAGCGEHRYIPALIGRIGELMRAQDDEVEYRKPNGTVFTNGSGPGAFSSQEIRTCASKAALGDPGVQALKDAFNAKVVA